VKKSKYTDEQIAFALKQAELWTRCAARRASRTRRFTTGARSTVDWAPSEVRRLCQLEEENTKLKRLVADLSLDKAMLQDLPASARWWLT
jgi:putative transposase